MRYASIAMLIFCIHVSIAILNASGVMHKEVMPYSEWFDAVDDEQLANTEYVQGQIASENVLGFGDFIKALFFFVASLAVGILAVPYTLSAFGVVAPYVYLFSLPIYIIYFVAIAEYIRGTEFTPR